MLVEIYYVKKDDPLEKGSSFIMCEGIMAHHAPWMFEGSQTTDHDSL